VVEGYSDDPQAQELLTELTLISPNDKGYSLEQGVIKFKNKVWIGNNQLAQRHILEALHNSGVGGHSGIHATYKRVNSVFSWPKTETSGHRICAGLSGLSAGQGGTHQVTRSVAASACSFLGMEYCQS
jgi:hypothetical protein